MAPVYDAERHPLYVNAEQWHEHHPPSKAERAHEISPQVRKMIAEYCQAKKFSTLADDIGLICPRYPTRLEALRQAALRLIDQSIPM